MASSSEESLKQRLEELQKQLGKKQRFEEAVFSINSLLQNHFSSASASLRKSFYTVVCRVATVLKTRYTAPGFWLAGLRLFEVAEGLFSEPSEKGHMQNCISQAKQNLHEVDDPAPATESAQNGGYLFEGHLTVDPEPPQPQWVQEDLMNAVASGFHAESSGPVDNINTDENASHVSHVILVVEKESAAPRVLPASKKVVAKLPVINLTEEILAKVGPHAKCSICEKNLVLADQMQELPCKHTFHPPCLKRWLDEHNSCPICQHELQTDDHAYEGWKERKKEAEEERKGAANAVRGSEHMYV